MFGIGRRMKAVHGQGPGEPRQTGDKFRLAQDQAALAIVVAAAAIILVAVASLVLARNLETLARQTEDMLERQADMQGVVRGLSDELNAVKAALTEARRELARLEHGGPGASQPDATAGRDPAETIKAGGAP